MIWARMLAYITGTVDQELLLRNEYLAAENRILRAGRGQAGYYAGLVSQAASVAFSNRSSFLTLRDIIAPPIKYNELIKLLNFRNAIAHYGGWVTPDNAQKLTGYGYKEGHQITISKAYFRSSIALVRHTCQQLAKQ